MAFHRFALFLIVTVLTAACSEQQKQETARADSGVVTFNYQDTENDKAIIFPLIGRWYPVHEVRRLSDRTLTAEEWCSRPAERILIEMEKARVQCIEGTEYVASVADVKTTTVPDEFVISFRSTKDAPLRQLIFSNVMGVAAEISKSPCDEGKRVAFQRFPEFDVIRRKIVEGRPCPPTEGARKAP